MNLAAWLIINTPYWCKLISYSYAKNMSRQTPTIPEKHSQNNKWGV